MALLEGRQLQIAYRADPAPVYVLDRATFSIGEGECLGLMGESGSGVCASTTADSSRQP